MVGFFGPYFGPWPRSLSRDYDSKVQDAFAVESDSDQDDDIALGESQTLK